MADRLHIFFNAWVFFTRLPGPQWVRYSAENQRDAVCCAPLIGWFVGAVSALILLAGLLLLPASVAVVLSMAASAWLTGALHEDGWADVCDGFGAGGSRDRIIEVMRDSRNGAFALTGVSLLLLLKCAALFEIAARLEFSSPILSGSGGGNGAAVAFWPSAVSIVAVLVCGHALSRLAVIALVMTHRYVGDTGDAANKSTPMVQPLSAMAVTFALVCGVLPLLLLAALAGPATLAAPLLAIPVWWWLARMFRRKLGGYTGDCLGAVQQLCEVAVYLGILIFALA